MKGWAMASLGGQALGAGSLVFDDCGGLVEDAADELDGSFAIDVYFDLDGGGLVLQVVDGDGVGRSEGRPRPGMDCQQPLVKVAQQA
jgi:hypothetical protein